MKKRTWKRLVYSVRDIYPTLYRIKKSLSQEKSETAEEGTRRNASWAHACYRTQVVGRPGGRRWHTPGSAGFANSRTGLSMVYSMHSVQRGEELVLVQPSRIFRWGELCDNAWVDGSV